MPQADSASVAALIRRSDELLKRQIAGRGELKEATKRRRARLINEVAELVTKTIEPNSVADSRLAAEANALIQASRIGASWAIGTDKGVAFDLRTSRSSLNQSVFRDAPAASTRALFSSVGDEGKQHTNECADCSNRASLSQCKRCEVESSWWIKACSSWTTARPGAQSLNTKLT